MGRSGIKSKRIDGFWMRDQYGPKNICNIAVYISFNKARQFFKVTRVLLASQFSK